MQVGDLVRFIGVAAFYRDRVGVVARFDMHGPLVHFASLEGQGRDAPSPCDLNSSYDGLHPMHDDELEVINASR